KSAPDNAICQFLCFFISSIAAITINDQNFIGKTNRSYDFFNIVDLITHGYDCCERHSAIFLNNLHKSIHTLSLPAYNTAKKNAYKLQIKLFLSSNSGL